MADEDVLRAIEAAQREDSKILQLGYQDLTTLPESLFELANLEELYLHCNHLVNISESIGKLTHLRVLSLLANDLRELPESIGNLANLDRLYLAKNKLMTLPESLGRLPKLDQLSLADNPDLSSLPATLHVFSLDISDCKRLTSLPDGLTTTILDVHNSGLTSLPPSLPKVRLRWRGIYIPPRMAFQMPETIDVWDIIRIGKNEDRGVLLERMGYKRFMRESGAEIIDTQTLYSSIQQLDSTTLREPIQQLVRIEGAMEKTNQFSDIFLYEGNPGSGAQFLAPVSADTTSCQGATAWLCQRKADAFNID